MNRLRGRPKTQALSQALFDVELDELTRILLAKIPETAKDRRLGAQDYQGCLCEFDKYRRLQLGEGKVRARYDGVPSPWVVETPSGNAQMDLV